MLCEVIGDNRAHLAQGLMVCVTQAGGEHVFEPEMGLETGHLDSLEIEAFAAQLESHSEFHPMDDPALGMLLIKLINQMRMRYFHSVIVIDQADQLVVMASPEHYYFDDILVARDEAVAAKDLSKFQALVEQFKRAQATITLKPA